MAALEQELREMEIRRVSLNVFAHNGRAGRLYSKMGYVHVSSRMSKALN
jgi:ribosomal protein S18 acetylase RimI-like enzyme